MFISILSAYIIYMIDILNYKVVSHILCINSLAYNIEFFQGYILIENWSLTIHLEIISVSFVYNYSTHQHNTSTYLI